MREGDRERQGKGAAEKTERWLGVSVCDHGRDGVTRAGRRDYGESRTVVQDWEDCTVVGVDVRRVTV